MDFGSEQASKIINVQSTDDTDTKSDEQCRASFEEVSRSRSKPNIGISMSSVEQPEHQQETNTTAENAFRTARSNSTQMQRKSLIKTEAQSTTGMNMIQKNIELNTEFCSFLELRDAIDRYQREKSVQLIVKDSKLLKAESTRKVIPKVHHLVNADLMYHSITYCCKCHGELKQKPGTRIKNIGAKRLNCPMYFRLKLTSDLQRLVLFDIHEIHNHGIDPTTCQLPPRQQVYTLSRLRHGKRPTDNRDISVSSVADVGSLVATAIKDVSSVSSTDYEPPSKVTKVKTEPHDDADNETELVQDAPETRPDSPLDSESSFTDSEDEDERMRRHLLPFPIRLIGSAVQSSPELLEASRQLIELQKANLELERQKLLLQTRHLELANAKLELEVKKTERSLAAEMAQADHGADTTIYLQTS